MSVTDLADDIDREGDAFLDSLAILSLVDTFVTTDTALAHVAGSAGIRTWLLLSHVADWRWGIESDRSIWYPSLRLLRQPSWGDWSALGSARTLSRTGRSARGRSYWVAPLRCGQVTLTHAHPASTQFGQRLARAEGLRARSL